LIAHNFRANCRIESRIESLESPKISLYLESDNQGCDRSFGGIHALLKMARENAKNGLFLQCTKHHRKTFDFHALILCINFFQL